MLTLPLPGVRHLGEPPETGVSQREPLQQKTMASPEGDTAGYLGSLTLSTPRAAISRARKRVIGYTPLTALTRSLGEHSSSKADRS